MTTSEAIAFYSIKLTRARNEDIKRAYHSILDAFKAYDYNDAIACIHTNVKVTYNTTRRAVYRKALHELDI